MVFFFPAEDGIRSLYVTGVQTCALPISRRDPQQRRDGDVLRRDLAVVEDLDAVLAGVGGRPGLDEIGRASCRERVWIRVVAVAVKKKAQLPSVRRELEYTPITQYGHHIV